MLLRTRFKLSLLAVTSLVLGSAHALAGSVDAGKISYNFNCLGCHGDGANPNQNARVGAASPTNIANAIKSVTQMRTKSLTSLSATDLSNIATYLDKPMTTDADRIFSWGEYLLPTLLKPAAVSANAAGYYFRYYAPSNVYVGAKDGHIWFFDGNNAAQGIVDIGTTASLIPVIEAVPGKDF